MSGDPLPPRGSRGLTGERWEAYSQLLFLRARYYQPGTGRFVTQDLWPGHAYAPQTINRWVYVRNDPVRWVDPSGLQVPEPVPTPGPPVAPQPTPMPTPPGGPQVTPTPPPGIPTPPPPTGTPCPCDPSSEASTQWLLETMQRNANGPVSRAIRFFLDEFELPGDKCCAGRIAGRLIAWDIWINMVKANAPWDFKNFVH